MERKEKLTIKKIAELAGVSPTAVSFALNNKKGISRETEKRIMEVVEKYDYIPDKNSLRLHHKKSYNICLMMNPKFSPFEDLFYFEVTKGIMQQGLFYNYNVVITQIEESQTDVPDIIKQNDTDGIIFFQNVNEELLANFETYFIPCVFVDSYYNNQEKIMVNPDYEISAYTSAKYLLEHGHKKIGMIGPSYPYEYCEQTSKGFLRALSEFKIAPNQDWVKTNCQKEKDAYDFMASMLKRDDQPPAIFGVGDIYAIGAMQCVLDRGLHVPDDFSFIGLDDIILSRYISVPLTTVTYDKIEMGKLAMDLLVKQIDGEKVESVIIKSDHLLERKSVKKC
jgi:DNA-binding LacI/PurR family transcriptional regulator